MSYDPQNAPDIDTDETHDYEVSVANVFDATSPEDAVRQMVAWLVDNAQNAGYRVTDLDAGTDETAETRFIDAEDLNDIDYSEHEGSF